MIGRNLRGDVLNQFIYLLQSSRLIDTIRNKISQADIRKVAFRYILSDNRIVLEKSYGRIVETNWHSCSRGSGKIDSGHRAYGFARNRAYESMIGNNQEKPADNQLQTTSMIGQDTQRIFYNCP